MGLNVPYSKATDKNKAFESARDILPEIAAKFGIKADTQINEKTKCIKAKGKGFSAQIEFIETNAIV